MPQEFEHLNIYNSPWVADRLVFPIVNNSHEIVGHTIGRTVLDAMKNAHPLYLYLGKGDEQSMAAVRDAIMEEISSPRNN